MDHGHRFSFGAALDMMRDGGHRVQRDGWNGKDMWICYQPGYPDGIAINANTAKAIHEPVGMVRRFLPYIMMRTVNGAFVPWLASQTDILANDWSVVSEPEP